jgi:hypothetical protein
MEITTRMSITGKDEDASSAVNRRGFLGKLMSVPLATTALVSASGSAHSAAVQTSKPSSSSAMGGTGPEAVTHGEAPKPKTRRDSLYLETSNGWYTQEGKVIWGYARANQWWGGYRGQPTGWWTDIELGPTLIRNDPGQVGPNRTEDLEKLTDNMVVYGYPGFEHTPPLWYDRRRDAHDTLRRADGKVVGPYLEMPWVRSHQGQAWDGLPLYDLTKFNPWYFARLRDFAGLCDRKKCILIFNFYNQHNLLETQAHYADYPWRPVNCIQATDLPDTTPAANAFYDVTHPVRKDLHRQFIWHCLDILQEHRNVVLLTGREYTGPLAFMQFWFETILEWEQHAGRKVHIGVGATKDVVDAMLQDPRFGPRVGTIDLRYAFYGSDDTFFAPLGGREVPGRYTSGASQMTPQQIYRQVREYRRLNPDKAILHNFDGDQKQTMAFLMAGGSMLVRWLDDVVEYPSGYQRSVGCESILTTYDFIRTHLAEDLPRMRPLNAVDQQEEGVWCLGEPSKSYLIYMLTGRPFRLDLSAAPGIYDAKWIGLRLGKIFDAFGGTLEGGKVHDLRGLDWRQWMLWLKKRT